MKKDTRLTFRVSSDLKRRMEAIAASEGRSMAQICEAFLKAGSENYRKEGMKILQRFLVQRRKKEGAS
jgi:predicted transcriptional regulator